jgi:hypothetical protein
MMPNYTDSVDLNRDKIMSFRNWFLMDENVDYTMVKLGANGSAIYHVLLLLLGLSLFNDVISGLKINGLVIPLDNIDFILDNN